MGPLGAILGPLGATLGPLGAFLEPSWAPAMRRKPRKIRGFRRKNKTRTETLNIVRLLVVLRHLAHLAPTWGSASGRHGAIWAPFGATLDSFMASLGPSGAVLGRLGTLCGPVGRAENLVKYEVFCKKLTRESERV